MRTRWALSLVLLIACFAPKVAAEGGVSRDVTRAYDDVRFELADAIIRRGLSVHSEGDFGKMLDRTGADVGSTTAVYARAEFVTVCSAKLARAMVEADPSLMGNCPFTLYAYETVARPGVVTVGYRRLTAATSDAGRRALEAIEQMLAGIVAECTK
jgi:uncharacterized protein (DUF302 family)